VYGAQFYKRPIFSLRIWRKMEMCTELQRILTVGKFGKKLVENAQLSSCQNSDPNWVLSDTNILRNIWNELTIISRQEEDTLQEFIWHRSFQFQTIEGCIVLWVPTHRLHYKKCIFSTSVFIHISDLEWSHIWSTWIRIGPIR
jgi:hypothetical protein